MNGGERGLLWRRVWHEGVGDRLSRRRSWVSCGTSLVAAGGHGGVRIKMGGRI